MMRSMKIAILAMIVAMFTGASALAESQTICPLMGGKIDEKLYADHDGKRVYFCCPMCVKKFKGNPEKSIKKLEDQGVTLETTTKPQTTCPLMDRKIDKNFYADHDGQRVYLCCKKCVKMFKKNPEMSIKKFEDQGITLEKVQTICPLMGDKIDKKLYVDHNGKRVYLCCQMCVKKFKKNPEMSIKKLEDQGITLEKTPGEHHEGMSPHGSQSKEK